MTTNDTELFRFSRAGVTRIFVLRTNPGVAELWRITETPGEPVCSIKETEFAGVEEAFDFLDEVKRTLIAGHWRECGPGD